MSLRYSPKTFAKAIGVSESSLKRWADQGRIAVLRTPGGHRRIEQAEAIRFIREEGLSIIDPKAIGLAAPAAAGVVTAASNRHEALRQAIMQGETAVAVSLLLSLYIDGESAANLCDGPITQALHEMGDKWKHGDDGIHLEHRATVTCLEVLVQLRAVLPTPPADAPLAIGCSPEGDPYLVPSLMVAVSLQSAGWRAINLGANLPMTSLQRAAEHHQPRLVWISVSVENVMDTLMPDINHLASQLVTQKRLLIAGGRAWTPPRGKPAAGLHWASSMVELTAFAKGLGLTAATGK